jgi:hypothetical protein
MKTLCDAVVLSVLSLVAGCAFFGPSLHAPEQYTIGVLIQGKESAAQAMQPVADWMTRDMVKRLQGRKLKTEAVAARDKFSAGPDKYLLAVKVLNWNTGGVAGTRAGYGAAAVSVDVHYELLGQDGKPVLAGDTGAGAGSDWTDCAADVDAALLDAVLDKLIERQQGTGAR